MSEKTKDEVLPQKHTEQDKRIIAKLLSELENTEIIETFEFAEGALKRDGAEPPENLEELRKACLQKNKTRLETEMSLVKTKLEKINRRLEALEK